MKLVGWGDPSDDCVSAGACRGLIVALHPRGVSMSKMTNFFNYEPQVKPMTEVMRMLSRERPLGGEIKHHRTYDGVEDEASNGQNGPSDEELLQRAEKLPA